MTGKKTKLLIAWLICALLLLGACGRQAAQPAETAAPSAAPELTAEPAPEPTPEPASEATPEPAPEPVLTAELLHVCNGEDNEFCLAASADGTRFLIARRNPTDYTLWVQNADGSDKRDLVLAGMTEEDAKGILGLHVVRPQKGVSIEEAMNERLESLKKQYGSYVNALTHTFWQQLSARYITTAGDYILLTDHAAWGSARINMRTGETALLPIMAAQMDRNGTVLCFDTNSSGTDRYTGLLRPDQSVPEEADYILPAVIRNASLGCRLMTDGTLWMIDRQYMDAVELDGRSFIPAEVSVVHYDSSGKELRRISGGVFADSVLPDCLLYSEETGIGIVYSNSSYGGFLWYFGPEDDSLIPLQIESLTPPALRRAERSEVVDGYGRPLESRRGLYVIGLSGGGTKLLAQDLESANLFLLDLRTLKGEIMLPDWQIALYMNLNGGRMGTLLYDTGWNGGDVFCFAQTLKGYAVRLPFREAD